MAIACEKCGELSDGRDVHLFTLSNQSGFAVEVMDYGGIITSILAPGREGSFADVVLGFDELDQYLGDHPYFGAIVGRYANRIAGGRFRLEGKQYNLAVNNPPNHIHGGEQGFSRVLWESDIFDDSLSLHYVSEDGEEGYPGRLSVDVIYTVTPENELRIDYRAETDRTTIVNLTNHTYYNLAGEGDGDVLDHLAYLNASQFTPIDEHSIPTGELWRVENTPLDFRTLTRIGDRINQEHSQLQKAKGFDHNYVLDKPNGELGLAARVIHPDSGRVLEMQTTEPGVQFYTGNYLSSRITGKSGHTYPMRSGFCLEAQKYPDSPNKPEFPSPVLEPGDEYTQTTIYTFSAVE